MSAKISKTVVAKSPASVALDWQKHAEGFLWMRETIESIVVAFLLAFLFRTFEAEPFVIPTGSMAPTLLGAHKDIDGEKTGYRSRASTSMEFPEVSGNGADPAFVLGIIDPMSRFPEAIDKYQFPNHDSFCGDRILVSKFIYDFSEPRRWDVIVFKYPRDAKVNYIKRLIGLPGESIRVFGGDIWAKPRTAPESAYRIQRKPDARLLTMLQLVDDTNYIAADLQKVAWPSKWQPWKPDETIAATRSAADDKDGLKLTSSNDSPSWMRYYQILPSAQDWFSIHNGDGKPSGVNERVAELITDFAPYNATYDTQYGPTMSRAEYNLYMAKKRPSRMYLSEEGKPVELDPEKLGMHWMGDLAIEIDAKVESNTGALLLDLVKNGEHFQCRIDVASGEAVLSRTEADFTSDDGATRTMKPKANTNVKGAGAYKIRYSNLDQELRLWINGTRLSFDGPTTYGHSQKILRPHFTRNDPLDLAPVGIGVQRASTQIQRIRVFRDIYYSASSGHPNNDRTDYDDYRNSRSAAAAARQVLLDPSQWQSSDLLMNRSPLEIDLFDDQFLPMGDNSAQSADGRYWGHVDRHLLVGKALAVYWTHPWTQPPYWPEFGRIRFIR